MSDRARPYDREGRVGESRSVDELLGIGVTPTTTHGFFELRSERMRRCGNAVWLTWIKSCDHAFRYCIQTIISL